MPLSHYEFHLRREIIALSESSVWEMAKLEWDWVYVYDEIDDPGTCLCTHHPIVEHCVLANRLNGNPAIVGNCCVKKFLGLKAPGRIFDGIKRIRKDIKRSLNIEAIEYAFKQGWIDTWQHGYYISIRKKRTLSDKQMKKKIEANMCVLEGWISRGRKAQNNELPTTSTTAGA